MWLLALVLGAARLGCGQESGADEGDPVEGPVGRKYVAGDPYRTGTTGTGSLGLDAELGLSTDFTLDATFNPDLGQVEADPSVLTSSRRL